MSRFQDDPEYREKFVAWASEAIEAETRVRRLRVVAWLRGLKRARRPSSHGTR